MIYSADHVCFTTIKPAELVADHPQNIPFLSTRVACGTPEPIKLILATARTSFVLLAINLNKYHLLKEETFQKDDG